MEALLVASGTVAEATMIYWDVRLPQRLDTVEIRVGDVCSRVDETVMLAGLARGPVRSAPARQVIEKTLAFARPALEEFGD